jgi:hypothetical protein
VVLVIVDQAVPEANQMRAVECPEGECFGRGYVKDVAKDAYLINCVEFVSLGVLPAVYQLTVPGSGGWRAFVPMPPAVVERLISPYHREVLESVLQRYQQPRYVHHYMQMLSCD